ncbi:MAG: hypothetical protein U0003_04675 [Vampirovibrionales bacterium]
MAQPQSASSALFLQLSPIRTVLFNHNDPASALSQLKAFQYKRGYLLPNGAPFMS